MAFGWCLKNAANLQFTYQKQKSKKIFLMKLGNNPK